MKCKNAVFVFVISLLFVALCLAVAFGLRQDEQHVQNLEGYCELAEAVILKKMNLLESEIEALDERVTILEEMVK
jgi:hypothetical protein